MAIFETGSLSLSLFLFSMKKMLEIDQTCHHQNDLSAQPTTSSQCQSREPPLHKPEVNLKPWLMCRHNPERYTWTSICLKSVWMKILSTSQNGGFGGRGGPSSIYRRKRFELAETVITLFPDGGKWLIGPFFQNACKHGEVIGICSNSVMLAVL